MQLEVRFSSATDAAFAHQVLAPPLPVDSPRVDTIVDVAVACSEPRPSRMSDDTEADGLSCGDRT